MYGAFVIPADLSHEIWPYAGNTAKFLWPIGDRQPGWSYSDTSGFHCVCELQGCLPAGATIPREKYYASQTVSRAIT